MSPGVSGMTPVSATCPFASPPFCVQLAGVIPYSFFSVSGIVLSKESVPLRALLPSSLQSWAAKAVPQGKKVSHAAAALMSQGALRRDLRAAPENPQAPL